MTNQTPANTIKKLSDEDIAEIVRSATAHAFDEIAQRVQDHHGVETGDFASHFFSDKDELIENTLLQLTRLYEDAEIAHNEVGK